MYAWWNRHGEQVQYSTSLPYVWPVLLNVFKSMCFKFADSDGSFVASLTPSSPPTSPVVLSAVVAIPNKLAGEIAIIVNTVVTS